MNFEYFFKILLIFVLTVCIQSETNEIGIVNGRIARIEDNPWHVAVNFYYWLFPIFWRSKCSGAIIGKRWVLSGAHCFEDSYSYSIRTGTVYQTSGGTTYKVKKYTKFPYVKDVPNDIAILELEEDIEYNDRTRNIIMAEKNETVENYILASIYASGWGQTCLNCPNSDVLMETTLSIITNSECNTNHRKIGIEEMCVKDWDAVTTLCFGDSGGPFTVGDSLSAKVLIGVIRGGNKECDSSTPSYGPFIPSYRDWIKSITGI